MTFLYFELFFHPNQSWAVKNFCGMKYSRKVLNKMFLFFWIKNFCVNFPEKKFCPNSFFHWKLQFQQNPFLRKKNLLFKVFQPTLVNDTNHTNKIRIGTLLSSGSNKKSVFSVLHRDWKHKLNRLKQSKDSSWNQWCPASFFPITLSKGAY